MAGFLDRLLSGRYPQLESLWRSEFERLADELFGRLETGSEDHFGEPSAERLLSDERASHEATRRELGVVKAELKSAKAQLEAVRSAVSQVTGRLHEEPIG